ncbi:Predicted transcriptional regulator [Actinacidiphila yanglinensis]|uniref:Predicted transcriptional regulator n=1 Tax=Actinacidiphila yanglinensis TaxID=310779 RepID=A0A1H6BAG7_9ACTN|nr:BlaI/MecI/CopY family transcriptional regulator [Actinacidiphila yanglinensis]SEG57789.1 Predicted transcriptional regulator [Actinacidiphila yanglinensis]
MTRQEGATAGRRAPGELESEVLAALWAAGEPVGAGAVREQVAGDPAYTTVLTILTRLYDKGLVTRKRAGRGYLYSPVHDEAGHVAAGMRDLLEHGGDRAAVLARFVSSLPDEDEKLLEELLRDHLVDPGISEVATRVPGTRD